MILFTLWTRKFSDSSPRRREMRGELERVLAELRVLENPAAGREFAALLDAIARNGDRLEQGLVAWLRLVELLVQAAEQSFPDGRGAQKKGQVKSALYRLLNSQDIQIPEIPQFLQPLIFEIFVDWSVDVLVENINRHELWDSSTRGPDSPIDGLKSLFGAILRRLGFLFGLVISFCIRLQYSQPLSPELEAALQHAQDARLLAVKRETFGAPTDLLLFLARNRRQVQAGLSIFFEVVKEAERFRHLTGAAKKKYARDLVIAALETLGLPFGDGLFFKVVTLFIDAGIEAAFDLFDRRGWGIAAGPQTEGGRGKANKQAST